MTLIYSEDLIDSIADALQFVSYYHPADFVEALKDAWQREKSPAAKNAIQQLLVNSRLSAYGKRPICQDTGVAHVFLTIGMEVRFGTRSGTTVPALQEIVDEGVRRAYRNAANPLRASIITNPLGNRRNTQDNTPAIMHLEMVAGNKVEVTVAAKGGGGDVKARFATLNPSDSVADWIVDQVPGMGAGWCPPGVLGVGIGGTPEQAMLLAKKSLFSTIDIHLLRERGAASPAEALRLEVADRVNALGIGAQGLGGLTTVLDVKVLEAPCHAATMPVALIPNCAATRYLSFSLDGSGPALLTPPDSAVWNGIPDAMPKEGGIPVNLNGLCREDVAKWKVGQTLLLSGKLLTGRDAAHKRLTDLLSVGEPLPVDLRNRAIYYVGPVDAIDGEAVGPAGPTTSTRMDKFVAPLLKETGLLVMIGKAERGRSAIKAIRENGAVYLIAVGGAGYLVSKAVMSARVVAFPELGMEAIYEFEVRDMPVTVAVDAEGKTIHTIFEIAAQNHH
ncbi:fumarate hydratase [Noviherbaspirillum sp. CPCC 100848]|uniref:Fumarate hydratase class I n=1 Tax=Noviherbaspirillum album TaxID=3080276 RepID=A0ABU6JIC1_9BURK|nr:fumarate hydratase [Noviherbaspirillum sp. CPCC 100848]MEC4722819.1 fumarate hydratase [Noviherbaspirillum sp. CPCC 100848]